ncbi:MAG: hypothetical protein FWG94_01745 [Oscillospiraceae bacterium]|nr:hypothetical protein [Oscillospiraceae bacterium]
MRRTVAKGIAGENATTEQMERINLFTRHELEAGDVYVFTVILCDNEIDRDGERFPTESLESLGELFIGKTGVFDHNPKAENQSARIFETKLITEDAENSLGEPYRCLKAWAYMVRCEKNADLILEIEAGIKKEVSVGCAVEQVLCSVCGTDQKASACGHKKGDAYDGVVCYHELINPTDAYEWSFVAVPAQKNAGVTRKGLPFDGDLKKLFEENRDVVLSKFELMALKAQYTQLETLAEAGKTYVNGLRRDIVKLAALTKPQISGKTMETVAAKLEIPELLELKKAFDESAAYPVPPQLKKSEALHRDNADFQFKI